MNDKQTADVAIGVFLVGAAIVGGLVYLGAKKVRDSNVPEGYHRMPDGTLMRDDDPSMQGTSY